MRARIETLREVAAGHLTVEEAARRHGVTPATVIEWSELFLAGAQARRPTARPVVAAAVLFGALGLAGAARAACNAPVFGNLIGVCADTPAIADDYNANLQRIDTRLDAGVASVAQLRNDLNATNNYTSAKVGALGTTGTVLQAPTTFGGNVCGGNEVVTTNSSNAVDCRPLYGLTNSPVITAWETGDVGSNHAGTVSYTLASTANTVCFLSDVRFADIDDANEETRCLVERSGTDWTLIAIANGDSHAYCRARCLQFNW